VTSATVIPAHRTTVTPTLAGETWSCTCGATGAETVPTRGYRAARDHAREAARPYLVSMDAEQLAELLRVTARGDWSTVAAVELLIAHGVWLRDRTLRDYLIGEWIADGRLEVRIDWRNLAVGAGAVDVAVVALARAGVDADLLDEVGEHESVLPPLDGTYAEVAVLRIAASIGGDMPVRLTEEFAQLGDAHRGLVLTAISHLITHGGGVSIRATTTRGGGR
jgi:hypothetical protein